MEVEIDIKDSLVWDWNRGLYTIHNILLFQFHSNTMFSKDVGEDSIQ
jgi:hypothetical protein